MQRLLENSRLFNRVLSLHLRRQPAPRISRCGRPYYVAAVRAAERSKGAVAPTREQKEKLLEAALADINQRFGAGTIMKLGQKPNKGHIEMIPTGALTLDVALGGGLPKGRVVEIFGPESSGKTTLALHAIAAVQKGDGLAALIDAEHAFDPDYAKTMGVDVENLLVSQPTCGEDALETVDRLIRSDAMNLIVVDSVAALIPRAELEGEIGNTQVGGHARLMSHALRKLPANANKSNITTVIFINQLRQKIGVIYGNPEVTTGGNALKYYSSVRIDVRRTKTIEGPNKEGVGIKVRAKVVKNKVAPPFRSCEFDIMFKGGISTHGCLLDAAEQVGVIARKGGWYSYNDNNIGQGREKTIQTLKSDPDLAKEIENRTREKLTATDVSGFNAVTNGAKDSFDEEDELQDEEGVVVA